MPKKKESIRDVIGEWMLVFVLFSIAVMSMSVAIAIVVAILGKVS